MKMYTYDGLNESQKTEALQHFVELELQFLLEGCRYDDAANGDTLQAKVDAAIAECERLHTPWFAGEAILETCKNEIESLALGSARQAIYYGGGDVVALTSLSDDKA